MESLALFYAYLPLVESLSLIFGQGCGIALYDLETEKGKAVATRNLGTKIVEGDPCNETISEILKQPAAYRGDRLINQKLPNDLNRAISVILLPDSAKPQFVLYIERDLSGIRELEKAFGALLNRHALDVAKAPEEIAELSADNRVRDLLHAMIVEEINAVGIHPARLTLDEKVAIVHKLSDKGTMMIDGAIPEIARQLLISEPTVYRYLNRSLM